MNDISIMFEEMSTKIHIFGVGGCGGNALNNFIRQHGDCRVKTIAVNTDNQDLNKSNAQEKILIGEKVTKGRGTGAHPDLAEKIAEQEMEIIDASVKNADMAIICCGLGGGTGSGVSPVIARAAKKNDALTLAIATVPFKFEGGAKIKIAKEYLTKLKEIADAVIVVPNTRLIKGSGITMQRAFEWGNEILGTAIQVMSDLINETQYINVDFEDIKTVLKSSKDAYISMATVTEKMIGEKGKTKGELIVDELMNFPLIDAETIKNIQRAILYVEMGQEEDVSVMDEIQTRMLPYIRPNGNIIPSIDLKPGSKDIRATLIAGDFERDDNEYYFSDLTTMNQQFPTTLFGDVRKVSNMTNRNVSANPMGNLDFPPRMDKDID